MSEFFLRCFANWQNFSFIDEDMIQIYDLKRMEEMF